jgi:D-proline reductase (dithiol) PrdB
MWWACPTRARTGTCTRAPAIARRPPGKGIDLSKSRLALVSSAGGSLISANEPFDAENPISDFTIRRFPVSTPLGDVRFDHTHFDHAAVEEDPQVQLPLRHLEEMVADGIIGELTENVVSFSGYQPDIRLVANEVAPRILDAAREEKADAALLVPA